jgi:hypothetical protein
MEKQYSRRIGWTRDIEIKKEKRGEKECEE